MSWQQRDTCTISEVLKYHEMTEIGNSRVAFMPWLKKTFNKTII